MTNSAYEQLIGKVRECTRSRRERVSAAHRGCGPLKSYVVTLMDRTGDGVQAIRVDSPCPHNMQEFVDNLVRGGDTGITLAAPVVVDIDERKGRRLPAANE